MKLLILADIHANWPALQAVLSTESDYDTVAFCGDVVDYGPHPTRCVRWVANYVQHRVRGNHDNALGFGVDCHSMEPFREYSVVTRGWHDGLVSQSDREFLRSLPTLDWFEWKGKHFRVAHATAQGDLFEYLTMDQWEERVQGFAEDFVLLGHTHVQGLRTFRNVTVVNPGSVGLARDCRAQACYAVYDGDHVELRRIRYDVGRTISDLRSSPLPPHVIEGLSRVLDPKQQTESR